MQKFYFYLLIYIMIFSIYMIYFFFKSKYGKKKIKMIEVFYIERRYKLDLSTVDLFSLNRSIALANSFIFTATYYVMTSIDNLIIKTLVAFVTILFLIWIMYTIIGNIYKRKLK